MIQICTIEQLLNGEGFTSPITGGIGAYKDAQKVTVEPKQGAMEM